MFRFQIFGNSMLTNGYALQSSLHLIYVLLRNLPDIYIGTTAFSNGLMNQINYSVHLWFV